MVGIVDLMDSDEMQELLVMAATGGSADGGTGGSADGGLGGSANGGNRWIGVEKVETQTAVKAGMEV